MTTDYWPLQRADPRSRGTSCHVTARPSAHWARSVQTPRSHRNWSGWRRRRRRRAAAGRGRSSDPDSPAPRSAPAGWMGGVINQTLPHCEEFRVRTWTCDGSPGSTSTSDTWCWLAEADQEATCGVPVKWLAGRPPCLSPGAPGRTGRWCGRRGTARDQERLNGHRHGRLVVMSHWCAPWARLKPHWRIWKMFSGRSQKQTEAQKKKSSSLLIRRHI